MFVVIADGYFGDVRILFVDDRNGRPAVAERRAAGMGKQYHSMHDRRGLWHDNALASAVVDVGVRTQALSTERLGAPVS